MTGTLLHFLQGLPRSKGLTPVLMPHRSPHHIEVDINVVVIVEAIVVPEATEAEVETIIGVEDCPLIRKNTVRVVKSEDMLKNVLSNVTIAKSVVISLKIASKKSG